MSGLLRQVSAIKCVFYVRNGGAVVEGSEWVNKVPGRGEQFYKECSTCAKAKRLAVSVLCERSQLNRFDGPAAWTHAGCIDLSFSTINSVSPLPLGSPTPSPSLYSARTLPPRGLSHSCRPIKTSKPPEIVVQTARCGSRGKLSTSPSTPCFRAAAAAAVAGGVASSRTLV